MNNWFKAAAVLGLMACSSGLRARQLPVIQPTSFKKDSTYITRFGAVADGQTVNTQAINSAIDACNKKGGGVVVVPAGLWITGPLVLKSNVNLHLKKGAILQFTKDFNQYQLVEGNWEGIPQMRNQSPVSASNATNIAITGYGVIDGGGEAWRQVRKEKLTESQWKQWTAKGGVVSEDGNSWYPSEQWLKATKIKNAGEITPDKTPEFYKSIKDFLRPNLIVITKCKKVLLEGVTFQNSAAWCLHPLMSEDLTVRNVTVKNPWFAQNGDGIDVESCNRVLIENSSFDVGDDGLCMKSGRDESGRKRGMPTENVIIRDCKVYHAHGGFVIGSEMSGGARNIWVTNCMFIGTDIGLRFKTTRGRGGIVENIYCNDIQMIDIPGEAILFDMYYMSVDPVALAGEKRELPKVETLPVNEGTPQFKHFIVKNVVCNGAAKGIFIRGIPEMHVKDVLIEDCKLQADKGIDIQEASGVTLKNITILSKATNPVVDIINSDHLTFDKLTYKKDADLLFRVAGDRTKNISIQNTDATKAKEKITYEFGATAQDVTIK